MFASCPSQLALFVFVLQESCECGDPGRQATCWLRLCWMNGENEVIWKSIVAFLRQMIGVWQGYSAEI